MKIKWLKIDNQMVAVDTSTGEIVNDQLATLPLDYDVSSCVNEVLEDLFGGSLISTALINSPSKRGPKPKQVANPYASFFSDVQYSEDTGKSNMGDTLDDLVYSATTTSTGNTRIPVKQLVHVMRSDNLSTKSIQAALGKRRIIKGEEAPKDRYCQELLESASSLIKRIETHTERGNLSLSDGNSFSFDADTAAYKRSDGLSNATICPIEFTRGDRKRLRKLAVMGCLAEADAYVNAVRTASDRMMERIEQITPISTEQAYADLVCEFPYNPYEEEDQPSLPNKRINEKSNYHGTPPLHNGVGGQIAWHLLATSIYKAPITRKI